jgi:hypothetical protein
MSMAERVVNIRKAPSGHGQQYEIKWEGQAETTWEAASRVRKQIPLLVQAFEQQQQQQQRAAPHPQQEGATDDDDAPMLQAVVVPGVNSSMREQMAALEQMVRDQAQQLQQLRASPAQSPQHSAQASPQLSPQETPQQSRFARKEPRAQDLREYDGASGPKLDEWLDELGAAVDLFRLNDREAADFGTARLRGAARQWWNALGAGRPSVDSAAALGRALRARFQPVTTERVAREQLRALRQGSRNINDYIADFQRLRALLPDMSEADALFAFESGLAPVISLEIRKQGSAKLADALALAARIGGITAASVVQSQGRAAAANRMEVDDGDGNGASLDDRITRAVLNAMHSQGTTSSGLGGRTQTQRGYSEDRRGGFQGRGGSRGGRGGRFGGRGAMTYTIPGVPAALVDQRRAAGQCLRCGSGEHRGMECPNAPSASQSSN